MDPQEVHGRVPKSGLDVRRGGVEDVLKVASEQGDSSDDDDGDEGHHEAVLNCRGAMAP